MCLAREAYAAQQTLPVKDADVAMTQSISGCVPSSVLAAGSTVLTLQCCRMYMLVAASMIKMAAE